MTLEPSAAARWRRAREVFEALVDHPPSERQVRLDALCGGDLDLRSEVASLLSHDRPPGDTVDRVVAEAAAELAGWHPEHTDDFPRIVGHYRVLRGIKRA